jgi:hypothetical protein
VFGSHSLFLENNIGSYYLVLLYLGHFLKILLQVLYTKGLIHYLTKRLSLTLSRLVQPTGAMMANFLAKDNILFLDAIGGQRVLPYEYFQSFKVALAHSP